MNRALPHRHPALTLSIRRAFAAAPPRWAALSCAALLASLSGAALAQTAAPAAGSTPPQDEAGTPQQVTITARYRKERLQDAPMAITAISGGQIEARGYTNVLDVAATAPNVVMTTNAPQYGKSATAYIRGVGQFDFNYAMEPGVSVYIDDVYFGTVYGNAVGLMDVDRVEVLRGPQGTLTGKNSEGGAIRIYSARPEGDKSGSIEFGVGSYNRRLAKGTFDVPLADNLFLRVSAGTDVSDGYMKVIDFACANPSLAGSIPSTRTAPNCQVGTLGGTHLSVARGALRFKPSKQLDINLAFDTLQDRGEGTPLKTVFVATGNAAVQNYYRTFVTPRFGIPLDSRFIAADPLVTYAGYNSADPWSGLVFSSKSTMDQNGVTATVEWDSGMGVRVKSITGWRKYDAEFSQIRGSSPIPLGGITNSLSHEQKSQELIVSGAAAGGALDWTTGLYYYQGDSANGGPVTRPHAGQAWNQRNSASVEDKALFVHLNYRLGSQLSLEAGARYTDETKSVTIDQPWIYPVPAAATGGFLIPPTMVDVSTARVDPKLGLRYQFSPTAMAYLQYSTGFKSGGTNPRPLSPGLVLPFGPEKLEAYEAGVKTEWLDRRVRANAAVFQSHYKDLQMSAFATTAAGQQIVTVTNVGRAVIRGIEAELSARPIQHLQIDAQLGLLKYDTRDLGAAAGVAGGPTLTSKPIGVPERTANLGLQYAVQGGGWTLTPRVEYSFKSKIYNDAANTEAIASPALGLWNARISWEPSGQHWSVVASVANLADKAYFAANSDQGTTREAVPGMPRTYMLSVRRRF